MRVEYVPLRDQEGNYSVRLVSEPHGRTSWEAKELREAKELLLGTISRGKVETDIGPVDCWVFNSSSARILAGRAKATLSELQNHLDAELFQRLVGREPREADEA